MLLPGDQKKHMPTAADLIHDIHDILQNFESRINSLEENQKLVFSSVIDLQNRVSLLEGEDESTTSGS
jgi:hypothetical protein